MDRRFECLIIAVFVLLFSTVATANPGKGYKRHDGVITVLLVDQPGQAAEQVVYELQVADRGKHYRLQLPGPPGFAVRTGQRVRVLGKELPGARLGVREIQLLEVGPRQSGKNGGGGGDGGGGSGKKGAKPIGGVRTSAVILINLLDAPAALSAPAADAAMWGEQDSVQDIYRQDTRGGIDFVRDSDGDGQADVYGPYDVPMHGADSCDYRAWSDAARAQISAEGLDLDGRDHYVYVLAGSAGNDCSFGGVAELAGDEAWINSTSVFVFAHELGHNLNLHHAGSDRDNDGTVESFYGDRSCLLGAPYRNIFLNAPHKEALGILSTGNGAIVDIPASPGTYHYVLEPLALSHELAIDPQILRIPRNDLGRDYYLSLRDTTAYDANLSDSYRGGVSIHWYTTGAPGTVTGYVGTLATGESFTDLINGVTVTQNAVAADSSWVDVSVRIDPVFETNAPALLVNSLHGQFPENTVSSDEVSSYAVSLTNNDAPDTPSTQWLLSTRNLPPGVLASFDRDQVTLAPGEQATVILNVDPNGAPQDTYVFYVEAVDADGAAPHHLGVDHYARLVVDDLSPTPLPPALLQGNFHTSKGRTYLELSWQASPSPDIALYHVIIEGDPVNRHWRSTAATSISAPWAEPNGSYTFRIMAENDAGKTSAPSEALTITAGRK